LTPKIGGHNERVDLVFGPPGPFIAASMKLAVVQSADGYSKLIADLSLHRTLLGKLDVVGIGRRSAADETRLRGDKPQVFAVSLSYRLTDDADLWSMRPSLLWELDTAVYTRSFGECFTVLKLA
jgi:hypothetical protein